MKREWNKKGQFYLIAAIIIASLIIGLTSIVNYSKKINYSELEIIKKEILTESSYVLDYASYKGFSQSQIYYLLLDFTEDYINFRGNSKNSYFIFGNDQNLTLRAYQSAFENANLTLDSESSLNIIPNSIFTESFSTSQNNIILTTNSSSYEFELKPGENFYFVISEINNRAKHVITN